MASSLPRDLQGQPAEEKNRATPGDNHGRRIRVLHSVGHLNRGGIETWLYQVITRMDRCRFEHHVLVRTTAEEPFTRAFVDAGIPVLACVPLRSPLIFYRNFRRILREHGPYDVLHAHGFSMLTTLVLFFAMFHGIRVRILHGHNDLRARLRRSGWSYRAYAWLNLRLIRVLANKGIACSSQAAEWTFGEGWQSRQSPVDLMIGIDMEKCMSEPDPALRARLKIPAGRFVIAQIGRFTPAKNHAFTIELARQLASGDPPLPIPFHMLMIGDGPLRAKSQDRVRDAGLKEYFTWVADSDEVPAILRSVVDLQLLPSVHEGLGLVLLEAQVAGVPSIVSDSVTRECTLIPALLLFLPIDHGPDPWAKAVTGILLARNQHPLDAMHRSTMLESRFNVDRNVQQLSSIYKRCLSMRGGRRRLEEMPVDRNSL